MAENFEFGGLVSQVDRFHMLPSVTGRGMQLEADLRHTIDQRASYLIAKRLIDIVGSALGLLLLAPVMALIAIANKLQSPGPVFFTQIRQGLNGEPFRIYKFRTFYADQADPSGVAQTCPGDCRVTPFGRFLRRANLDELPQLWNVLRGDMSLVGPRPHVFRMLAAGVPYETLVPDYDLRHVVRPGITGLAQANGFRGPTTDAYLARKRIEFDLAYVQQCSILLDLTLIVLTIVREFRRQRGT